jgi:SPW repeat
MATVSLTPPRQWEDWLNWILGFWLLISPWVLDFAQEGRAVENAVVIGFVLILAEGVTLSFFQLWEEWINVALGLWLCVSPWALGLADAAATANFIVVGLLVVALAGYEMRQVSRTREPGRRPAG